MSKDDLKFKCIQDFGEQWNHYTKNKGYYGSNKIFLDICGPKFDSKTLINTNVVDIGAGTGRLTKILINLGANHIWAVEPSNAMDVLKKNTASIASKITYFQNSGENFPNNLAADLAISIGVLHHIPEPIPTLENAYKALKDGGKIIIWVYGREGNTLYLYLTLPIRLLTKKLPHKILVIMSKILAWPVILYARICKKFKFLPMSMYMTKHINKLGLEEIELTIYDQLNPAYSKYYTKDEAQNLLKVVGFKKISIHHRHGYSWTVTGVKLPKN